MNPKRILSTKETDAAALAMSRRYTLIQTFGDGRLSLYRVESGG